MKMSQSTYWVSGKQIESNQKVWFLVTKCFAFCEWYSKLDDNSEQDQETWLITKTLRGHLEDVYDLAWSMDSLSIISGSVDNTAIVWDVKKGRSKTILSEHKSFVQGVAWDPRNKYMATLSSDRYAFISESFYLCFFFLLTFSIKIWLNIFSSFRLYSTNNFKMQRRINKSTYPVDESSPFYNKTIRLFHDDTLQTFYRRICFSPDGLLMYVAPAVHIFSIQYYIFSLFFFFI